MKRDIIVFAAILVLGLVIAAQSALLVYNSRDNCLEIEKLKENVVQVAQNSKQRLSKIQYYREHPNDLREAQRANQEIIEAFSPSACTGIFGR